MMRRWSYIVRNGPSSCFFLQAQWIRENEMIKNNLKLYLHNSVLHSFSVFLHAFREHFLTCLILFSKPSESVQDKRGVTCSKCALPESNEGCCDYVALRGNRSTTMALWPLYAWNITCLKYFKYNAMLLQTNLYIPERFEKLLLLCRGVSCDDSFKWW